jgi:hypothetical protein
MPGSSLRDVERVEGRGRERKCIKENLPIVFNVRKNLLLQRRGLVVYFIELARKKILTANGRFRNRQDCFSLGLNHRGCPADGGHGFPRHYSLMQATTKSTLSVELILEILYNLDAWSLCYYRCVSQAFNHLCIKALMLKISHEQWIIELRTPSSAYAHYFNPDYISPQVGRLVCKGYNLQDQSLKFYALDESGYYHRPNLHELQLHCKQWPSPIINLPRRALEIGMLPYAHSSSNQELALIYNVVYKAKENCQGCNRPSCNERDGTMVQPQSLKVALSWILHGFANSKITKPCGAVDFDLMAMKS